MLYVTPYMGVWIEINENIHAESLFQVTPYMGVWIEILQFYFLMNYHIGHSLHGSVD